MKICVFFGHKDCPESVSGALDTEIEKAVLDGFDTFYVGNQGRFDFLVYSALRRAREKFPQIYVGVALAYVPTVKSVYSFLDPADGFCPDGIEFVPKRFAISYRNKWMVERAERVIAYVTYKGGAAQFTELAERKGKEIINLAGKR